MIRVGEWSRLNRFRLIGSGGVDGRWKGSSQFNRVFERCNSGFEGRNGIQAAESRSYNELEGSTANSNSLGSVVSLWNSSVTMKMEANSSGDAKSSFAKWVISKSIGSEIHGQPNSTFLVLRNCARFAIWSSSSLSAHEEQWSRYASIRLHLVRGHDIGLNELVQCTDFQFDSVVLGDNAFERVDPINVAGEASLYFMRLGLVFGEHAARDIEPLLGSLDFEPDNRRNEVDLKLQQSIRKQ